MLVSHSTFYVLCELLVIFVNVRFCQDLRTMHALWQSGSLYEKSKSIDILISFFFFQEYIFVLKMFTWKRWQKSNRSRRRFIAIDPDWASAGPGQVWIESKNHRVSAWVAARSRRIDKTLPGIPSLFWFLNFFMIDHFNFLRSHTVSPLVGIFQLKSNTGGE